MYELTQDIPVAWWKKLEPNKLLLDKRKAACKDRKVVP